MIIKTTFNDNDYMELLENYWNGFWFKNYYRAVRKIDDLKEYKDRNVEAEELLQKAVFNQNKMTMGEVGRFLDIIKESILDYIKEFYSEQYEYLSKQLKVMVRFQITDKNENGEVLYYFLGIKKHLVF